MGESSAENKKNDRFRLNHKTVNHPECVQTSPRKKREHYFPPHFF
ncbi:hypothetical protein ACU8KH_06622 [Lachancea thermotolerans]